MARKVTIIPAKADVLKQHHAERQINVCAYCRVSTDSDEQLNSVESQKEFFTKLIHNEPKWKFAGTYSDDGISGGLAEKRPAFMQMINDAKKGKINLIITKSISRFSRNVIETLQYIRELKEVGVGVLFYQDNLNSLDEQAELVLTILATLAQQDLLTLSTNVKTGIRMKMKDGDNNFPFGRVYGYKKGEDDKPVIIPEEAEMIRLIYEQYLMGYSIKKISKNMGELYTPRKGKEFGVGTIDGILKNEVFCGDLILQKTFVSDPITKKVKKNNGELPKVYIQDNHQGIVTRELFEKVQVERARRSNRQYVSPINHAPTIAKFSSKHALSSILICAHCGAEYTVRTWTKRSGLKQKMWRCGTRLNFGTKYCQHSPSLDESAIEKAILQSIDSTQKERKKLIKIVKNEVHKSTLDIMRYANNQMNVEQIETISNNLKESIIKIIKADDYSEKQVVYDEQIKEMSAEVVRLNNLIEQKADEIDESQVNSHIEYISNKLEDEYNLARKYSNELVKQLIHTIKVNKDNTIEIFYNCGLVDKQTVVNEREVSIEKIS